VLLVLTDNAWETGQELAAMAARMVA
jgi:hypothetical protein